MKKETKTGWVNIHISTATEELYISRKPYKSKEEAQKAIFHGIGIEKVACIKIEYTKPD